MSGRWPSNPPVVHRISTWDNICVLKVLTSCPLKELTLKTIFLVDITSASRVAALSVVKQLWIFLEDRVTCLEDWDPISDPNFLLKENTHFHRSEEVLLLSFCLNLQQWHSLDVGWALFICPGQHHSRHQRHFVQY